MLLLVTIVILSFVCMCFTEDIGGWFISTLITSVLAAFFFLIAGYFDSSLKPSDKPATAQSAPAQAQSNSADNTTENQSDANTSSNQTQPTENKDDNIFPHTLNDQATKEQRTKWWDAWTKDLLDKETTTGCKDGVQIIVFGGVDGNGYTTFAGGYVRVHQDGKPYTCAESTDPAKESQS